ncbi:porin [Arsenophonus endosymbiont of Aleurodicus floccissimus]|uniref:porin n=1 Tax=Arsenophonus endosymbiont of Aleurodicus floccissimus TaxID=2152761 RepID=UPI0034E1C216
MIYNTDFGLSFGGNYSNSHNVNNDKVNYYANRKRAETWSIDEKYNTNNVYLASTYIETRNKTPFGSTNTNIASKTETFEIVAQYTFYYSLKPSLAYIHAQEKGLGEYGNNYLNKFVSLGSFYYFNKNFAALLDYKINLLNKNKFTENYDISTDNILGIGLVYCF